MPTTTKSQSAVIFNKAGNYMPGGVNSPVRAFKTVGGEPPVIVSGKGAWLTDVDKRRYLDYVGSWGPLIAGHAHPAVLAAIAETLQKGTSFGAPCEQELELAVLICELMPAIEKVRLVNSGTEATMTAIRLARGVTGRNKIIKFEGCYHGHSDSLLVKAGSGSLTLGVPDSAGIPEPVASETLVATFNDLSSVAKLFEKYGNEIAAVIVEPIAGNMNLVAGKPAFLQGLRCLCDQHGSLLIFDEVMTGFRVALGGAQSIYQIAPDLTTLGKVIGGGMPVAALGGKAVIMDGLAPVGTVYQAGTLSGNPVCMAAGLATLRLVQAPDFFAALSQKTQLLVDGLIDAAKEHHIPFNAKAIGGMFGLYFSDELEVDCYKKIMACDARRFRQFFHAMLENGVYFAPSPYEAGFVSSAHSSGDIEKTCEIASRVFMQLL